VQYRREGKKMKFKCNACGKIKNVDMRYNISKYFMTKRGYRSYCEKTGRDVFLKKVGK
jgi:hypothetical protein|tara:strand:- start:763 stop:936 length:174 start_codon:yes stop_codon:yes gene_type:complete